MNDTVVHLSTRDRVGGAARATYRLHRGLIEDGVDSHIVTQRKVTDDPRVSGPDGVVGLAYDGGRRKLDQLPLRRYPDRRQGFFSPNWVPDRIDRRVRQLDPGIVHLHWVGGGFLRPKTIPRLNGAVVWTLHDMWPFTGGCHYSGGCARYIESCGACPHLASEDTTDLSRQVFRRKQEAWSGLDLTVVTPSAWLSRRAEESRLFDDATVITIPNAIDTDQFRPRASTGVRERFGLSEQKLIVGAGADWDTPRKGMDLLFEAMKEVSLSPSEVDLVLFGRADPAAYPDVRHDTTFTGFIDDSTLRRLYAEFDVVVVPSREEAFGQTASEALASGTPVVAFDATGPADIVSHEQTGYLARPFDPAGLADGIDWVLYDEQRLSRLENRARAEAVDRFNTETVVEQYTELYDYVVNER